MTEAGASLKPSLSAPDSMRDGGDMTTPTTPTSRHRVNFSDQAANISVADKSPLNTPTRPVLSSPMHDQRPLPDESFPSSMSRDASSNVSSSKTAKPLTRDDSKHSVRSMRSTESRDIEMGEGDEDQEGLDESENESVATDSENPPKKKKKGQRFYCTDFPPCHLSFTRSEHLARHIRKHTGERPFQCHCSRRFSRLDNLRQHAQTVHVNEEIPNDSLAATGVRFQRQIRTDRVRPPTARPRASTASTHGGHSRGHSRNISTSSIISNTSSVGTVEDPRPRPTSLSLHQDGPAHARHSLDFTFNPSIGNHGTQYSAFQQPQSGYSTPNSSAFSNGAVSPQYSSGMPSPPQNLSRSSFYNGSRTHSRRLSVPSGGGPPNMASHTMAYPHPYPDHIPGPPSSSGQMASPTTSVFSQGRRDSDVGDAEWRRRTWHPGSNYVPRPATSGLSYHQTPDDATPTMSNQPAASQVTRLPGIESFDHAPKHPAGIPSPVRNVTSPMHVDQYGRSAYPPPQEAGPVAYPEERRPSAWEAGLQHNLNRLEIGSSKPPSWHQHSRSLSSSSRPTTAPHASFFQGLQPSVEMRQGPYERERGTKRQAWYGSQGAGYPPSQPILIGHHRNSPESIGSEGIPTPSSSQGRELHPAIRHANGMIEMPPPSLVPSSVLSEDQQRMMQAHYQHSKPDPIRADSGFQPYPQGGQMPPAYMMQSGHDVQLQHPGYVQAAPRQGNDMGRLEALAAVATSGNRAVEDRP